MKKIENYEKFKELYVEAINHKQLSENEIKYFYNEYLMLQTDDQFIVLIEKKPEILTVLWYDDEMEAPEKNVENFINYNLKANQPLEFIKKWAEAKENFEKIGAGSGRWEYEGLFLMRSYENENRVDITGLSDNKDFFIRYLTEAETSEILEIQKELTEKYIKRLKNYWKRYNKNICVRGYWANR